MIRFIFLFLLFGQVVFAVDPVFDAANVNRVRDEGLNGSGSHFPNLEVNDRTLLSGVIMGTETDVNKLQHIDGEQRSKLQSMVSVGTIGANPTTVGSLIQWVRGDLGVTLNGATVSAWADQSGLANHYLQGTASRQPTYLASWGNGQPAMQFDGVDDLMNCAGITLTQPYTIAYAWNRHKIGAGQVMIGGPLMYLYRVATSIGLSLYAGSPEIHTTPDFSRNVNHIGIAVANGASSSIQIDNLAAVTGDPGSNGAVGLSLGCYYGGSDLYCDGVDIAEVLVYSKALTTSDIATVKLYLNNRYAIY